MGGIIISLISSIGGQSLGIGTIISKDIVAPLFQINNDSTLLKLNRCSCVLIMFLPLTLAVFRPKCVSGRWVAISMVCSTAVAILATFLKTPVKPMFLAVAVSFLLLLPGLLGKNKGKEL